MSSLKPVRKIKPIDKRYARLITRRKYYYLHGHRHLIVDWKRTHDKIVFLTKFKCIENEYGIYTDLLVPGYYPADSFFGGKKEARSAFREIARYEENRGPER